MGQAFIISCVSLVLYTVFGMALMPDVAVKESEGRLEGADALAAPLLGAAVWQAASLFLGFLFPYNKVLLIIMFITAGAIVFRRRNKLYVPKELHIWLFIAVTVVSSLFVIWCVLPREINGGLYFTASAFDHQRTAMINAIAGTGLPPLNPYLAVGGVPGPLYYHFGVQAVAAQYCILLGVSGLYAGAAANAFIYIAALLAMGGIVYKLTKKKISLLFLFLFAVMGGGKPEVIPQTLQAFFFPEQYIGFWSIVDDMIWSLHSVFGGSITALIIWFYFTYLKCTEKKDLIYMSLLLGMMAAAAVTSSIYTGGCALLIFALAIAVTAVADKELRQAVRKILSYQLFGVTVSVLLCISFILYINQSPSHFPLSLGFLSAYKIDGVFDAVKYFVGLYLVYLPAHVGLSFLIGLVFLFVGKPDSDRLFWSLMRVYVFIVLASIFFIHGYSRMEGMNDYGWRTFTAVKYYLAIFAAAAVCRFYEYLRTVGKAGAQYVVIVLMLGLSVFFSDELVTESAVKDLGTDDHVIMSKARKGWEVIRENTTYADLVTCNPEGFKDFRSHEIGAANYLFGFYADRLNCISDYHYPKTCGAAAISDDEQDKMYARVVNFFAGNPDIKEVNYMADELKVKALLVTPKDGLWNNPGELEKRYGRKIEGDQYRAYLQR